MTNNFEKGFLYVQEMQKVFFNNDNKNYLKAINNRANSDGLTIKAHLNYCYRESWKRVYASTDTSSAHCEAKVKELATRLLTFHLRDNQEALKVNIFFMSCFAKQLADSTSHGPNIYLCCKCVMGFVCASKMKIDH